MNLLTSNLHRLDKLAEHSGTIAEPYLSYEKFNHITKNIAILSIHIKYDFVLITPGRSGHKI